MLRTLAERMSRGITLRRDLPPEDGGATLFVSPEAGGLRYWKPGLAGADPRLLDFVRRMVKPGARVFDLGANVGLFTFSAAYHAGPSGKIVAVEADADVARLLRRTNGRLDRRRHAAVEVVERAVSEPGGGSVQFAISPRARSANAMVGFGTTQMGGTREVREVRATTVDELTETYGAPDVLKMDIEFAEVLALRGASKTLAHRPAMHLEVGNEHAREVADILRPLGYTFRDGDKDGWPVVDLPPDSCIAVVL